MSKQSAVTDRGRELLFLDPSQIEIDAEVNVRPFSATHDQTDEDGIQLQRLIKSIEENGQEQPVIVRPNGGEAFKLVAGNRRLAAINIVNAGREEKDQIKVMAVISEAKDVFRAAYDENDKRQDMTPMNKCLNFKFIREREGWTGAKGDKKVAEYFGVNVATVVQYRKLEALSPEIQNKIHQGVLSMDAALVVANVGKDLTPEGKKELQEQIVADAEIEERKRLAAAGDEEAETAVVTGVAGKSKKKASKTKTRQAKGGKGGVSAASVKKAARDKGEKLSRNRKTILEWFEGENGPAYRDNVRDFLTYFIKWADGDGTDRTLGQKFEAAVGKAGLAAQSEIKKSGVTKTNASKKK